MQEIEPTRVLIVDDKPENLYALRKLLAPLKVDVLEADSGFRAMELALKSDCCVAIVDVQMPEMDGYELVEFLRSNPHTRTMPVIFVSAIFSDEYHHQKGYEAGAVDFISKPFNPDILLSKIRVFIELYQQRQALRDANAQLRAMNASKDKFFSIVAHDLRAPFNPLIGLSRYFADVADGTSYSEIRTRGKAAYQASTNVYDLLENLLQWSRLQRGRMEYTPSKVDLALIVRSNIQLLKIAATNKDIALQSTLPPALLVQADYNMTDTIIRNLLSNALKFTAKGGHVTVAAHPLEETPEWSEISVRDTGVGISPEDMEKLFKLDAHHSTAGTASETGTGLGLILCREMVTHHGGRIWMESEQGSGTTVKFTLPLVEAQTIMWDTAALEVTGEMKDRKNPTHLEAPPSEELRTVHKLAKLGNMRRVEEWCQALAARDAQYQAFAGQLQELAQGFQKKQLLAIVEEYLNDPKE